MYVVEFFLSPCRVEGGMTLSDPTRDMRRMLRGIDIRRQGSFACIAAYKVGEPAYRAGLRP